jgi:AmmeMemoRadiSam system protein A
MTAAPAHLTREQQKALVALARDAVRSAAQGRPGAPAPPAPPDLDRPAALFVTVRIAGQLRGCLGTFDPQPSLWATVHAMAAAAATRDPRFGPVSAGELERLTVEISLLSPPTLITSPASLILGRHGVEVRRGGRRGVLLPQVATEHQLGVEGLLSAACRKAGLPASAWREPETELRVFEALVF